ncbi:hypothetical protein CU098_003824, partial [Rhizopus stolonifer]
WIDTFTNQEYQIDPVRKKYDTYFIILCPGTNAEVQQVQRKTPFLDYPFVSTDGGANALVKALKVQLSEEEFMPAMLRVSPHTLSVNSVYIGRGPGQYFENYLLKHLVELRYKQEIAGITAVKQANEAINLLKRRETKCQEGKLVSTFLSLSPNAIQKTVPHHPNDIPINTSGLNNLPRELLEAIFYSFENDIPSLVNISGTCRLFYSAICNVIIQRLRAQIASLIPALPKLGGNVVWEEMEIANIGLDRWPSSHPEGVPFNKIARLTCNLEDSLAQINQWTRYWNPRRMRSK